MLLPPLPKDAESIPTLFSNGTAIALHTIGIWKLILESSPIHILGMLLLLQHFT
jgi:hypothetical protein